MCVCMEGQLRYRVADVHGSGGEALVVADERSGASSIILRRCRDSW